MIQSLIVAFLYGAESLDIQIYSQNDLNIIIDLLSSLDVCQQTHRQTLHHHGQVQHGRVALLVNVFFATVFVEKDMKKLSIMKRYFTKIFNLSSKSSQYP